MSTNHPAYEPPISEEAVSNALVTKAERFRRAVAFDRRFGIPILLVALLTVAYALFGLNPTLVAYQNWQADRALAQGDAQSASVHQAIAWTLDHKAIKSEVFFVMGVPLDVDLTKTKPDAARCATALRSRQAVLDLAPPSLVRSSLYVGWAMCDEVAQLPAQAYNDYMASVRDVSAADNAHLQGFTILSNANRAAIMGDQQTARRLIRTDVIGDPFVVAIATRNSGKPHRDLFPALASMLADKSLPHIAQP